MKIKEITFQNPPASGTMELGLRYVFIGGERVGKIKWQPLGKYEFTPYQCNFLSRVVGTEDFIRATITEETKNMLNLYFN